MKKILRNAFKCNKCGDVIESLSRHDFKTCSCGAISVDGGHDYIHLGLKQGLTNADYENLCEWEEECPYSDEAKMLFNDVNGEKEYDFYYDNYEGYKEIYR